MTKLQCCVLCDEDGSHASDNIKETLRERFDVEVLSTTDSPDS